jgi:hypothetical protein
MKSDPLRPILPAVPLVLDYLDPREYHSFSSTCRDVFRVVKEYEEDNLPLTEIRRRRAARSHLQHQHPATGMDASPLVVLPPELIFHVLDFMHPHEYSGLPGTCQGMLSIVNQKLDTSQSHRLFLLDSYLHMSRTATFVKSHRIELERFDWQGWLREMDSCYIPRMDEEESDYMYDL